MSLQMWTVYDHPADFPDSFVARRFDITQGQALRTGHIVTASTLEGLRELLIGMGMDYALPRQEDDDLNIVETWL